MKVKALIKNPDGSIYVETTSGKGFRVSLDSIAKFNIHKDLDLTNELIQKFQNEELRSKLLSRIILLISNRPRSILEIRKFLEHELKTLSDGKELENNLISYLISKKYLDDEAFCSWWVQNRLNNKLKSSNEIKNELMLKGIDKDIINKVFKDNLVSETEIETIKNLYLKKFSNIQLDTRNLKQKQKIFGYFLRKGYTYDLVNELYNEINNN